MFLPETKKSRAAAVYTALECIMQPWTLYQVTLKLLMGRFGNAGDVIRCQTPFYKAQMFLICRVYCWYSYDVL